MASEVEFFFLVVFYDSLDSSRKGIFEVDRGRGKARRKGIGRFLGHFFRGRDLLLCYGVIALLENYSLFGLFAERRGGSMVIITLVVFREGIFLNSPTALSVARCL